MKRFHLIYSYLCLKRNCGIKENSFEDESFEVENIEEAKIIARNRFQKTKTSPDAWHFCYHMRLIEPENDTCYDFHWSDKRKIAEEIGRGRIKDERPINWNHTKEFLHQNGFKIY